MDASEIYSKRLNAKEVMFPKQGDFFSNRRWTNQNSWRISGTENIHLGTASTLPQPQDSLPDAGEAINDFLVHVRKLHTPPSR